MKRSLFVLTCLWFVAVIVGNSKFVPQDSGSVFSWTCIAFAAGLIFASRTFSGAGSMIGENSYRSFLFRWFSNDTSLPARLESREWPPFVYALTGYGFLFFGSFPLINQIVVRFILKSETTH